VWADLSWALPQKGVLGGVGFPQGYMAMLPNRGGRRDDIRLLNPTYEYSIVVTHVVSEDEHGWTYCSRTYFRPISAGDCETQI